MKRSALTRKPSEGQSAFLLELKAIRPFIEQRAEGLCEIHLPGVCNGVPFHLHHRRRRNIRKDGLVNHPANLMFCCANCHMLIHKQRGYAKEHGFIIHTSADPTKVPVRHEP